MIGILLFVLFFGLVLRIGFKEKWYWCNDSLTGCIVTTVILFFINLIMIVTCADTYCCMVSERVEIVSLGESIEKVRSSHYSDVKSGNFIGGSLDNMKQSSVLSEYVIEYSRRRAHFNGELRLLQGRKKLFIMKMVGGYLFISDEVFNIKPIE